MLYDNEGSAAGAGEQSSAVRFLFQAEVDHIVL
jgi:hypothetical protein